jgi:hypothetical protein
VFRGTSTGAGYYKTDFAECCGCTAMFRKPELFTVGRGKKVAPPGTDQKPNTTT